MSKNFEELYKCWNDLGVNEPYWSVLSAPQYLKHNNPDKQLFYNSGIDTIKRMNDGLLKKYNLPTIENKIVLDFGTGLGRLSNGLLHFGAKEIYALDISKTHLDIAKESVISDKIHWINLDEMKPISEYVNKKVDIIVSYIVLQHNRPDVLKKYVQWLLEVLDANGVALLHIPYHIPNYNSDMYVGNNSKIEMHCVPKEEIGEIIVNNNCKLIATEEENMIGTIKNCFYIIQKNGQ